MGVDKGDHEMFLEYVEAENISNDALSKYILLHSFI